ncbi:MAG: hypothetical protein IPN53_08875 [Comamonadaceae bacterium]|nr:hypothetical protein [Comamonadaceae bacterium]
MLYPNGQRVLTAMSRPIAGALAQCGALAYGGIKGARLNRFVSATQLRSASTPDGYGVRGTLPALKAGSMSSSRAIVSLAGAGSLLQAAPMVGSGSLSWATADASLSLVVSLSGSAAITWSTPAGVLKMVIGLAGAGSFTLTGAAGLSLIVPFQGNGAFGLSGAGDLRGILRMAGGWTPYTELSPQNLAREVWQAVAAQYVDGSTMGGKLNTASSGGVDLSALAQAVWLYAQRELTAGAAPGAPDIAAELLVALQGSTLPVNAVQMAGAPIVGDGSEADPWRGVGVSP